MAKKDREYEKFVRGIMQAFVRAQGMETVEVKHDIKLVGLSKRKRQIDVYWEYRFAGVTHRVIVNCKRYKKRVEVTDVEALGGALADLPGHRGMIVTTAGFQSGAVEHAKTHGIDLKIVREPEDGDWEGRIRSVNLVLALNTPELLQCQVNFNADWIAANTAVNPKSLVGGLQVYPSLTHVVELATGEVSDVHTLWNRAMGQVPTESGNESEGVVHFADGRIELPDLPPLKIDSIAFRWRVNTGEPLEQVIQGKPPIAVVRDAITGTILFIGPDGEVTGDIEEELGVTR